MWIIIFKSCSFDRRWRTQILSCRAWRRNVTLRLPFNLHRKLSMCTHVHGSPLGAFNLTCYNSSIERLRLSRFKIIQRRTVMRHVPPPLSENWWSRLIHAITSSLINWEVVLNVFLCLSVLISLPYPKLLISLVWMKNYTCVVMEEDKCSVTRLIDWVKLVLD